MKTEEKPIGLQLKNIKERLDSESGQDDSDYDDRIQAILNKSDTKGSKTNYDFFKKES